MSETISERRPSVVAALQGLQEDLFALGKIVRMGEDEANVPTNVKSGVLHVAGSKGDGRLTVMADMSAVIEEMRGFVGRLQRHENSVNEALGIDSN
jgi:hypothetical protein